MLDEMVRKLAEARAELATHKTEKAKLEDRITAEIVEKYGDEGARLNELIAAAQQAEIAADEALRAAAVAQYEATQDKRPHPAVTVKVYTTLSYEEADALEYCQKHLPKALKLDRREFEKVARAAEPVFVTFVVEPKATVATDLSAYVGEGYQAG